MISIPSAPPAQPAWRGLIRPMLFASIALHGLILFVPMPSAPEAPPEETEEKVSLTQLPSAATAATPAATPAARPVPTPARPTPAAAPTPAQRIVPRSNPVPPVPPAIVRPVTPPAPRQAQPAAPATAAPATTATPAPSTTAAAPATDPFAASFPRYPGAVAGSFGLPAAYDAASQRSDDAIDQVAAFFERELASAGYQVTAIDQPNRRAFQVTKDGATKVLTLIPNPEGSGTSIVLSDAALPEDLGSVSVESPAVQRFYSEIPIPSPDNASWFDVTALALEQPLDGLLSEPNAFFSSLGGTDADGFEVPPEPRAGYVRGVVGSGDPASLFGVIQPSLQSSGFLISSAGSYGGGNAYQVTRTDQYTNEQVNAYLVVVPTQDNRSVLFLWNRDPQG